uniref:Uncharacterized protein n=1 Tax=Vespula pensylvanica TaxID=30213 RepID=A0A834UA95_VESPE|nr:hypothetical protein H0235_008167 [Vespula pensylvanica]
MRDEDSIGNTSQSMYNLESSSPSSLGRRDYHSVGTLEARTMPRCSRIRLRVFSFRTKDGYGALKGEGGRRREREGGGGGGEEGGGGRRCRRRWAACCGPRPGPRPLPIPPQYTRSYDFAPLRRLYVYDDEEEEEEDDDDDDDDDDDHGDKKKGGRDEPRESPSILENEKDSLTVSGC